MSDFFLQVPIIFFCNSGPHAKFQNRSLSPSGLVLVSEIRTEELVIIEASLASAEVSAGAVPKADQHSVTY